VAAVSLILILLAAAAILNLLARRLAVPSPVLLVIGGLALAVAPGLPRAELDPDVVFLLFVPPLLYRAALLTSWRDFRTHLRSIVLLGVGLVMVTIAAIAAVAHAIVPGLPWSSAFLLGAIVAPSDPIAAIAVIRRLDTPRDIDTILEGEGLVNDATALVAYRMSVGAVASGSFEVSRAILLFWFAAVGGVAVGLMVGWAIAQLRRRVEHMTEVENTISLLTPFAAYIPADRLGVSGVLAVVAVGLYLGREGPKIVPPETRVQAASMWDIVTFLLEGLIFILIGLDLPLVTERLPSPLLRRLTWDGIVISGAAIAVRMSWTFPVSYLTRRLDAWLGREPHYPRWRQVFFVAWSGMRGADSLVVALALPIATAGGLPFPGRSVIIFVTFVVILMTLVAQGLTLRPLIQWLSLPRDRSEAREETMARLKTARAGIARLDELITDRGLLAAPARELRKRHMHRLHQFEARQRHTGHRRREDARAKTLRKARAEMLAAERRELVRLRDEGFIADDVMRRIQRELDLEQMLAGGGDETLEDGGGNPA
jgi:CPA1 family monovalent cation:H+ antiporter